MGAFGITAGARPSSCSPEGVEARCASFLGSKIVIGSCG